MMNEEGGEPSSVPRSSFLIHRFRKKSLSCWNILAGRRIVGSTQLQPVSPYKENRHDEIPLFCFRSAYDSGAGGAGAERERADLGLWQRQAGRARRHPRALLEQREERAARPAIDRVRPAGVEERVRESGGL